MTREQWNMMTPTQQFDYVRLLELMVDEPTIDQTAEMAMLDEPPIDEADTVRFEAM